MVSEQQRAVRVRVPATVANLGPGFDVLGLAVTLYNEFTVRETGGPLRIRVAAGGPEVPGDQSNLCYQAFTALCREADRPVPGVSIAMRLDIPSGRGLGSSATAVVGGLLAANALLGLDRSAEALLPLAVALEHGGHPDNVAPALLGGLVGNATGAGRLYSVRVPFPEDLRAVVYLPDFAMDTVAGRALMPPQYPKADVVFSTGRVALLLAALTTHRYDLLAPAMEDRLHQPYRAQLFPALPVLIAAAVEAGAYGACLSGGGSAVLALVAPDQAAAVTVALHAAAEAAGLTGRGVVLDVDRQGARAEWLAGTEEDDR